MHDQIYSLLQIREVFHLEFLRWFGRKPEANECALKGGVNLRFFFNSIRYSEDMDLDVQRVGVERIKKVVMEILLSRGFSDSLKSFGVQKIVPPDIIKAKQTGTTQRFKIHLFTQSGEDLFTKIEFSRRPAKGRAVTEVVSPEILRAYKMAPVLVSHYEAVSAVEQKVRALAQRTILQARDIFDLFLLHSQMGTPGQKPVVIGETLLKTAHDNVFLVEYTQFHESVVAYLGHEDQKIYSSPAIWDEIKLKTSRFLEELAS